jgi:hypothetical protein
MRPDVFLALVFTVCLSGSINAFPTTIGDIVREHSPQDFHDARVAVLGQSLDDLEKRADKNTDKGKGKANDPVKPPASKPAQTPQKPGGSGGSSQNPQTPANPPTPPVSNKKYPVFYLGECGSQGLGKKLGNQGAPANTPVRKPNQIPQTPKTPKTSDDEEDDDHLKEGTKVLDLCKKRVTMDFPNYPSSGTFFTSNVDAIWKNVLAYNAKVLDPCKNDYSFGKVTFLTG